MSIKIMSAVWDSGLDKNLKAVALAYADFANDNGDRIYPSIDRVAWKTGYNRRSVQRITKALCDLGVLRMIKETSGRPGETNRYKFIVENLPKREPYTGDIDDMTGDTVSPVRVTSTTRRVTSTTQTGDTVSPDPLENHQEPSEREEGMRANGKSPAHLSAFEISVNGSPLTEPLKKITRGGKAKVLTAAGELEPLGATPEQIESFPAFWKARFPTFDQPWPVQVVEFWDDFTEWAKTNKPAGKAEPDGGLFFERFNLDKQTGTA